MSLSPITHTFSHVVALRKESVDRNIRCQRIRPSLHVALRKESVDRNTCCPWATQILLVALRKESVDRNNVASEDSTGVLTSRSPQGERG